MATVVLNKYKNLVLYETLTLSVSSGSYFTTDTIPGTTYSNYIGDPVSGLFTTWVYYGSEVTSDSVRFDFTSVDENNPLTLSLYYTGGSTTYTVTFNAGRGSVSPSSRSCTAGSSITLPTPTWSGHSFDGWYTASSGGTYVGMGGATYTPTSSRTLYAHWTSSSASMYAYFKIASGQTNVIIFAETLTGHFSDTVSSTSPVKVASDNTPLRAVAVSTVSGRYMTGWSKVSKATVTNYGLISVPSSSTTANYVNGTSSTTVGPSVTVVDDHGSHLGTPSGTSMKFYVSSCIGVKHASTDSGYTFVGWEVEMPSDEGDDEYGTVLSDGGTQSGKKYTFSSSYTDAVVVKLGSNRGADVKITALYESAYVTLSYEADGGSPEPDPQTVVSGTEVTLADAPSRAGWYFDGWLIGSRKYAPGAAYTVSSSVVAYAQWNSTGPTHLVSYDKNADDATGDVPPSVSVSEGSSVTVSGADGLSREGYQFYRWTTGSVGGASYYPGDVLYPETDVTLYAQWTRADFRGARASWYWWSSSGQWRSGISWGEYSYTYEFLLTTNVTTENIVVLYDTCYSDAETKTVRTYEGSAVPPSTVETTIREDKGSVPVPRPRVTVPAQKSYGDAGYPTYAEITVPHYAGTYFDASGVEYEACLSAERYSRDNTSSSYYKETTFKQYVSFRGDEWYMEAPVITGYDFEGWYTIQDYGDPGSSGTGGRESCPPIRYTAGGADPAAESQIANTEVFTSMAPHPGAFCLLVSTNRTVSIKDVLVAKANYFVKSFILSETDRVGARYSNCIQLRYRGKEVLVLFDATGGEPFDFFKVVRYGQTYGTLLTPTWGSNVFQGWFTAESGGVRVSDSDVVSTQDAVVLYAHWQMATVTVTVTFDPQGGSVSPTSKAASVGGAYGDLPTPSKSGSVFSGWYTSAVGGDRVTSSTTVTEDIDHTLYAVWGKTVYTLTFDARGGTVSPPTKSVESGSAYGTLPKPTYGEYSFKGWYTSVEYSTKVTSSTVATGNATLYAKWGSKSVPLYT